MIELLSGENAVLKEIEKPALYWPGDWSKELIFQNACVIEHVHWSEGLHDCAYRVNEREFRDLSFLKGETLETFSNDYEIRKHEDGTKFLFSYEDIPTFDDGDRDWDSMQHMALYADSEGINLIVCRHGYEIPRIKIYAGLIQSIPTVDDWLKLL